MGSYQSTTQNPTETQTPSNISSSDLPNSQNPDPKTLETQNPDPKTLEPQNPEISNQSDTQHENGDEEEEEGGECGFCVFMKGGGCKDAFIAWENCVDEAEKTKEDVVEKCFEVTDALKKCMEAHSDYYQPILKAEKAAEEEVEKDLQTQSEKKVIEETVEIAVENDKEG